MAVANQYTVIIKKSICEKNFLQINNQEWQDAFKVLTRSAFGLYLYLAANAQGYRLELSQATLENEIGIKKSAYSDARKELIDKGYLVDTGKHILEFYSTPNK